MSSNLYATLAEYKADNTTRGQSSSVTTDTSDDAVITAILEQISRYVDGYSGAGRYFFPAVRTLLFDVPDVRRISIRHDLLEVTTLTNGDGTVIASTEYVLLDGLYTPYHTIKLRDTSTTYWIYGTNGNHEQVISLLGFFGYRDEYTTRAWTSGGTLGAAITDTTGLTFTASAGHTLTAGQIIKIDSELFNISSVATNTITVNRRGDNGSTAATHLIAATIYIWNVQEDIKRAVLMAAQGVNALRLGQSSNGKMTVTNAGVIIRPEEVPAMAQSIIKAYKRRL